ncbi:hypothetical protein KY290_021357 [Solanum tuberosum]|uniref:Transposase, Ptta/En/Spm, plant n=1 Tax=Solanum tuberosum TaxID=4113 RepID=A0ABQ7V1B7_SOLTU|nr:hypothetical protein KY290_021357 [Solanum tuberosum]
MSQSAALKKKGSNPNKAQSPLKNLNFDMQYRSSTELANQFKIKREQLANERNDKAKKEHAPIAHKRKNSEDFIPQQGKSKLLEYKSVIHSSSREELGTSHMVVGKGQTKKSLFQSGESIQEKGTKLPMHNFRFQTSSKKGVTASVHVTRETLGNAEEQHDIQDLLNFKQVKRKSVLPARSLDQFLEEQQLQKEHDIHDLPNCKQVKRKSVIPATNLDQFQKKQAIHIDDERKTDNHKVVDDLVDQEEIGGDKCAKDEEIGIDCGTEVEGKKWVMTSLHDAWRQYKQKIKDRYFDKNSTVEDMLAKRPDDMPEEQFRQLIKYWKHPTVQAMCEMNSRNRKKQKWRHRMGPINFARVRVALRATKENNEEPSKSEMFVATRTKTGKDLHTDTQVAIAELQNRQNSGETADDAFTAVFGKEQAGRIRCYGRSVTTSSLKKDEETNELKQKHANEITFLKEEMNEMREEMRHFFSQLLQNNSGLNVRDMPGCVRSIIASPIDASSAQAVKGQNLPHSSGSTHDPDLQKFFFPLVVDLCVVVAPAGSPCLGAGSGQKLKGCGLTF